MEAITVNKQEAKKITIDLTNVEIQNIKEERIFLFYERYIKNIECNIQNAKDALILTLDFDIDKAEEIFELPIEVKRALIASFRRQLKRQYKVQMLNEMLKVKAFNEINTVILQQVTEQLFSKGIDKDFITQKIKENNGIYKKPRRNENITLSFTNKEMIEKIKQSYKDNVYMAMEEIEDIYIKVSNQILLGKITKEEIEQDYLNENPNSKIFIQK